MSIQVAIIMGSKSDWDVMSHAAAMLSELDIQHEAKVISAHRTPDLLDEYCAKLQEKEVKVIIAGAGLAAALQSTVGTPKAVQQAKSLRDLFSGPGAKHVVNEDRVVFIDHMLGTWA